MKEYDINLSYKPKQLTKPFCDTGDKNTIPASGTDTMNYETGFPAIYSTPRAQSGKSVARKDVNAILNILSSLNYYFQFMGNNPWISGTSYPTGAFVWYSDAAYVSKTDDNTDTPGETTNWTKLFTASGGLNIDQTIIETLLGYKISIVTEMPSTPVTNTIYFIRES